MPTLSPVYLPYQDGTRSVEVMTARHADADIESFYLPYKNRTQLVEVVTARHVDADIESCLSPVKGRDTVGGSGDRQACRCRH
jgi:lysophospholipid acyltransferase (LPLAT)-like uncharacterized protein